MYQTETMSISTLVLISTSFVIQNTSTKRDYILITTQINTNWLSAEEYDSHLASIITSADLERAYSYSSLGGFIGLNDIDQDNNWSWIDETECDLNNSNYCSTHFTPNASGTEYCSILSSESLQINNFNCNGSYPQFYCNKGINYLFQFVQQQINSHLNHYSQRIRLCIRASNVYSR